MVLMNSDAQDYQIDVQVESVYMEERSAPEENRYFFGYSVTIRNVGRIPAQLKTRHWVITDSNGKVQEVRGEGVIGQQPHLDPGEGFQYSSGVIIETPVGAMHGSYQMQASDGVEFDAEIPAFRLATPTVFH